MRIANILDKEKRERAISRARKRVARVFARRSSSVPVFVFGKQRSGTTMMMNVFHARRDTEVFDERAASRAFIDYRIRSFDVLARLVERSKAPFVCFKPLADSHLIHEFVKRFPEAKMLWVYRNYVDSAMSSVKKWPNGRRAIRLVCTGQSGGGWFQEGVSDDVAQTLREVYAPELTELDLSCLVWWARNRLVMELELMELPNVMIVRYEDLVTDSSRAFGALFKFVGMVLDDRAVGNVVRKRTVDRGHVEVNTRVRELCDSLLDRLDEHVLEHRGSRGASALG